MGMTFSLNDAEGSKFFVLPLDPRSLSVSDIEVEWF